MKTKSCFLLLIAALGCATLLTGCLAGGRTQGDEVKLYEKGKQVRGPRLNLGNILSLQLVTVDIDLKSSVEEPAVVVGGSVLSKTGLESLNAKVASERGGTNTTKLVGYDTKGLTTDVSTNAAATVTSVGEAGGKLINKAATGK
jgi:hypothetical protein